jgi:hypothetical protein
VLHEGDLETGQAYGFQFTTPPRRRRALGPQYSEIYGELEILSDDPGLDTRIARRIEVIAD